MEVYILAAGGHTYFERIIVSQHRFHAPRAGSNLIEGTT